jgi:hypothetical protein
MTTLGDVAGHEARFFDESLEWLGERKDLISSILSLAHGTAQYPDPLSEGGTIAMGRLLVDASVAIEQAFVCTLRAQPRLGWASLRIAAEATKDLDCIRRETALLPLWTAVGLARTAHDCVRSQDAFKAARVRVAHTRVTKTCQTTMRLCSILGSHPNATALGSMGAVSIDTEGSTVSLPSRVTDRAVLGWHVEQLLKHSAMVALALAEIRWETLASNDRAALSERARHVADLVRHYLEADSPEVPDDEI